MRYAVITQTEQALNGQMVPVGTVVNVILLDDITAYATLTGTQLEPSNTLNIGDMT
ncbi:MAG: hypothetical protein JO126_04645 [Alphaproteobacteria bacterium]|nr:hypothetical protein [Alphaproteobacteria bacterium]MBV8548726.1 hypothetical protein [Alphaproteobacteria bacterium]